MVYVNFSYFLRARYNYRNTWPQQEKWSHLICQIASESDTKLGNSNFPCISTQFLPSTESQWKGKGKGFNCSFFPTWKKILIVVLHSEYQLFLSPTCIIFPYTHFFQDHICLWMTSKVIYFASSCLIYVAWQIAFILFSWLRWKFEKEILFNSLSAGC